MRGEGKGGRGLERLVVWVTGCTLFFVPVDCNLSTVSHHACVTPVNLTTPTSSYIIIFQVLPSGLFSNLFTTNARFGG